ncbi:Mss4-like protein [Gaertneriomyces semiglobifer]|nr:Mss4-like protein [Gaertneriomyces semiglobifer]
MPDLNLKPFDAALDGSYTNEDKKNAHSIHCPRCACVILRSSAAMRVENNTGDISLPLFGLHENDNDPPQAATSPFLWEVPTMMSFENIGFSKPVGGAQGDKPHKDDSLPTDIRYLSCADCDIGPVGAQIEGRFLVAADRVRYAF